jgi:prepilin-type N-terminal cleavage/methylation domain-containing protein
MKRGFTLIELITVISVIAILAGIVTPLMGSIMEEAKKTRMTSDVNTLKTAIIAFNYKNSYYPYGGSGLGGSSNTCSLQPTTTVTGMTTLNNLLKAYLAKQIILDPFNVCYGYWFELSGSYQVGAVCSYGPNRTNNGVWDATLWRDNRATPGDDYYDCFYKKQ